MRLQSKRWVLRRKRPTLQPQRILQRLQGPVSASGKGQVKAKKLQNHQILNKTCPYPVWMRLHPSPSLTWTVVRRAHRAAANHPQMAGNVHDIALEGWLP